MACVQVAPITSIYRWKGKVLRDSEYRLICKTIDDRWEGVRERIEALHSYATPEIIRVPITSVSAEYLAWLRAETLKP